MTSTSIVLVINLNLSQQLDSVYSATVSCDRVYCVIV